MHSNETIAVAIILAVVILVALSRFTDVFAKVESGHFIKFILRVKRKFSRGNSSSRTKNSAGKQQGTDSWAFRRWRGVLIGTSILLLVVAPVAWWFKQPAPFRIILAAQFNNLVSLVEHGWQAPLNVPGHATLEQLTEMMNMRAARLNGRYHGDEIWVVDHYWQYWNTSSLQQYLRANKIFVATGGKIHRMFFLSDEELHNRDVQAMLQAQCQIGKLGEDQTGNGFELWRANPKTMRSQEEYETISRQFQQLPYTDDSFGNFDVMQFDDAVYYSSDFSTDYRVLGSSTWIFNPNQVHKVDLRPLFKKRMAERIFCSNVLGQGVQQATAADAAPDSPPI